MRDKASWMRRRVLMLAIAAIGVAAISGTALAGHQTSGVKSYTGCLVSGEGVLIKIKEGNAPRSACTGGQVEAHFSGGDITKISVGSGLSLPNGGDNGEVRIELAAGQTLPQGCADGRVAEWDSGTSRWICGIDNDTTYSAGTGLDLSAGNAFSIEPAYRIPDKKCSTTGQFARGFDSNGEIQCAAPASAGVAVWQMRRGTDGVIVLPKGEGVDLIIMPLPAGTYLVNAVATVGDRSGTINGDEQAHVTCSLRNGAFAPLPAIESTVDIGEELFDDGPEASAVVHGAITLASADSVRFTCTARHGDSEPDEADNVVLTALKIEALTTP
jgi:hypothetical protein